MQFAFMIEDLGKVRFFMLKDLVFLTKLSSK